MKRLTYLLLSSVLCLGLMAGCTGNTAEEPPVTPIDVVTGDDLGIDNVETPEVSGNEVIAEPEEQEVLPEGMVRSSLTNELIPEEVANKRPVAVMIPMDKVAQPDFNNSKAGVVYEALVEGSITRTMNIIEDWDELEKIGNIRSVRPYFIFWHWEWDAILLHDGGPSIYVNDLLANELTNNISGAGFRTSDRSAPHNEYYSASIVNKYIDSYGYQREHRDTFVPNHFNFAKNGGQTDLTANYGDALEVYTVDLQNCYPVTKSCFKYDEAEGVYYRYIYGEPHMDYADPANPVQLSFSNIILQRCIGASLDDHDYRALEIHKQTEDGWFITNGHAIHITWAKPNSNTEPTRFYDDNGDEIELSTGKTIICAIQDGGNAKTDFIFKDSNGGNVEASFNN